MNKPLTLVLILVLAFAGIADAWYLTQHALTDTPLVCDIAGALDGCNVVAQSPYSVLFGVPLALYGVFFYALVFVLAAIALAAPRRRVTRGLAALGVVGVLASVVFIGIQIFLIKAVCLYCFGSALISLLIWFLTWHYSRIARSPMVREWEATRIES